MRSLEISWLLSAIQCLNLLAQPIQAGDIYISEVLADPPPGIAGDANSDGQRHSYQDEFVELFNAGSHEISLEGWRICDKNTAWDQAFVFPPNTILQPASYIVVFGGGTAAAKSGQTFFDDGRIGNGLSNKSDAVLLFNARGDTVDQMTGTPWPKDQSLTRILSGQITPHTMQSTMLFSPGSSPSRLPPSGTAASDSQPPKNTTVRTGPFIRQILADPPGDVNGDGTLHPYEDEFVELHHTGDQPISIGGWHLLDDDTRAERAFTFPEETILLPDESVFVFGGGIPTGIAARTFTDDGRIGNGLSNGGDTILLTSAEGDTVDRIDGHAWPTKRSTLCRQSRDRERCQTIQGDSTYSLLLLQDQSPIPSPHEGIDSTDTTGHRGKTQGGEDCQYGCLPVRPPPSSNPLNTRYEEFRLFLPRLHLGQTAEAEVYGIHQDTETQLDAKNVRWSSTDREIVEVNEAGIVRALSIGSAHVEIWLDGQRIARALCEIHLPMARLNRDPHIISRPHNRVYAEGHYTYVVQAEDPEGATLIYVLADAPKGWHLHYASGILRGQAPAQPGTYPISLEVVDGQGGIAHQAFSLQVLPRPRIRINEILADPPLGMSGDANGDGERHAYGDEFVELFNVGDEPINLDGMQLGDRHATTFVFPPHTQLEPDQYAVVFGSYSGTNTRFFSADGRIGNGLDNLSDHIYLFNPDKSDTLARATYSMPMRPRQSLTWHNERFSVHASPGVDVPFSPGRARPMLTHLRLADTFLSLIQGERRTPTLIAEWSTGNRVRIASGAQWTTSDSSVLYFNHSDGTIQARKPGSSVLTAQVGQRTTSPQQVTVHPQLHTALSFIPGEKNVRMRNGHKRSFSLVISDGKPLNFTWHLNGRRIAKRSKQIHYQCCQQSVDTLQVSVIRGRQYHSRQWLIRDVRTAKVVRQPWTVRAYPNPFHSTVQFAVSPSYYPPASLRIYDIHGRLVHRFDTMANGQRAPLKWDGRDREGKSVASGIYLYRIQQGKRNKTGKIFRIK